MSKTYKTKSGKALTDADIEAMAAEEETAEYDVEELMTRRGRPRSENSMNEAVQVRLDKELRAALQERAEHDRTTPSDVAREALRRYLRHNR
jgi:uncharacterized protein (DUF4415 family)